MGGLILLAIPLIVIPFVLTIVRFVNFFRNTEVVESTDESLLDAEEVPHLKARQKEKKFTYPEILFMGISPILGIIFVFVFKDDIKPFDINHTLSLGVFVVLAYAAYWVSKIAKQRVNNTVFLLLPMGMMIGILIYLAIFIHFISPITLMGGALLPVFGFALYAPLPAILFNIKELVRHKQFYRQKFAIEDAYRSTLFFQTLGTSPSINNATYYIATLLVIAAIQGLLVLVGQDMLSMMHVFTGGEGFLFSENDWNF